MSLSTNLVNCIKRILPVLKTCKNVNLFKNFNRTKAEQNTTLTSIHSNNHHSNHKTTRKSILYGFSLLSWFGLEENVDPETKLINTIKRGILFLRVSKFI